MRKNVQTGEGIGIWAEKGIQSIYLLLIVFVTKSNVLFNCKLRFPFHLMRMINSAFQKCFEHNPPIKTYRTLIESSPYIVKCENIANQKVDTFFLWKHWQFLLQVAAVGGGEMGTSMLTEGLASFTVLLFERNTRDGNLLSRSYLPEASSKWRSGYRQL